MRYALRRVCMKLAIAVAALMPGLVLADYPERPVKIVVGYAAGGGADIVARLMANELSGSLGQPFIVENRPGAANNIAVESVSRAAPDGYTLLLSAVTSTINQSIYKNLKFDFSKDFEHIAKVSEGGFFLLVPQDSPANSPAELAEIFRKAPGQHFFASSGVGTSIHATGEMFVLQSDVEGVHVPYRGSSLALTGLMGGETDFMFDNSALPLIKSGRLKALAVTTDQRSPHLPDLPTLKEAGYSDFESTWWYGLSAPAGTSDAVVDKLNSALMEILAKPDVREALSQLGDVPAPNTPQQYVEFIKAELERWGDVVARTGMSAE